MQHQYRKQEYDTTIRDLDTDVGEKPTAEELAEIEKQVEEKPEDGSNQLRLMGMKKNPITNRNNDSVLYIGQNLVPDDTAHVTMSVGRDGNLWLKTATGDWKRVVTE